jgi:Ankyrin repeats (3 copies)
MQRKDSPAHNQSPLAVLSTYIIEGETEKFIQLFELIQDKKALLNLIFVLNNHDRSYHELAMFHDRKEIFEYLLKVKCHETDLISKTSKLGFGTFYIEGLIQYALGNDITDFEYWLDMLISNQSVLHFSINELYKDLTLLQHICLLPEDKLNKFIKSGLLQKLIDHGAASLGSNGKRDDDVKAANLALMKATDLRLSATVIESMLLNYARLGDADMVEQFLVKIDTIKKNQQQSVLILRQYKKFLPLSPHDKGKEEYVSEPITEVSADLNIPNIDVKSTEGITALAYAAKHGHLEIVKLLLKYGASPLNAIKYAIEKRNETITLLLLQHGGGIYSDLPRELKWMHVDAKDCYVEGMTIAGEPVTPETPGFQLALHDVHALIEYRERQDKLFVGNVSKEHFLPGFRNSLQPMHSIKRALIELENDVNFSGNSKIEKSLKMINSVSNVPSLKWLTRTALKERQDDFEIEYEGEAITLQGYLEMIDPSLAAAVLDYRADKQYVIGLLNDRVDELSALHKHLNELSNNFNKSHSALNTFASIGCHCTYSAPSLYGCYSFMAWIGDCGCNCCDASIGICNQDCSAPFISKYAMYFFGVPGFVVLGILVVSISLMIAYHRMYSDMSVGFTCGDPIDIDASKFENVRMILQSLSAILANEKNIPGSVQHYLQVLKNPNAKFSHILLALINIKNYYEKSEMPKIQKDISTEAYQSYNPGLFFWTQEQREANRNNKLPPHLVMNDEAVDVQHVLGYEMFTIVQSGNLVDLDALPKSITMSEGDKAPTERTPLIKK